MEWVIDETVLLELIQSALPMQPDQLTTTISAAGEISASAMVSKQTLADSGLVTGGLRNALIFLPAACKLYASWQASAQDGGLVLTPVKMEISGITLPEKPAEAITALIQQEVTRRLKEWPASVVSITWADGSFTLHGDK